MNEQAVKTLTRKGCIVEKEAAENLKNSDIDLIDDLDTTPMYLSKTMLTALRTHAENRQKEVEYTEAQEEIQDESQDCEMEQVTFLVDCPDFVGVDCEVYGPFDKGDKAELPADNAQILRNRGMTEDYL